MAGRGREASQDVASAAHFVFISILPTREEKAPNNIPPSLAMETAEPAPAAGGLSRA